MSTFLDVVMYGGMVFLALCGWVWFVWITVRVALHAWRWAA